MPSRCYWAVTIKGDSRRLSYKASLRLRGNVTTITSGATLGDLVASVTADAPRLIVLSAPAGYRKGTFVRRYAERGARFVSCDLAEAGPDVARTVMDALLAEDGGRVGRSAAERLAQAAGTARTSSREALRAEWASCERDEVFALRDADALLAKPAGADIFAELVATLPARRVLALSTRLPLPPALQQVVGSQRAAALGTAELSFTRDEVLRVAADLQVDERTALAVHEIGHGWPLLTELLMLLLRRGEDLNALADAAHTLRGVALLSFALHRVIAGLDELVRNALVVAVLLRGIAQGQLARILGDAYDDLVFARLLGLPFVRRSQSSAIVHPEAATVLRERFPGLVNALYERTLSALTGEGAYVEAAHVALLGGDPRRAAAIIDATPPYTTKPVPLVEYERILERLDHDLVTRFPNVWIATIPYRSFAVDRATFVREAETVYYCLSSTVRADQRAAALMLLAFGYCSTGRREDADRLVGEALSGFAREPIPARAALLNFCAWLNGMDGRFTAARSLAAEADAITRADFGENQALHYIEAHEAAYRGQNERLAVIIDELLRRGEELPIHRANAAANGALFTWVNGDDARFNGYLDVLEDTLTPGLERGLRPILDAGRGRPIGEPDAYVWPIGYAQAQLFRLGNARDDAEALAAAHSASRFADERRDPYTRILAHAASFVLDREARRREADILERIVVDVESDEMRFAVRELLAGRPAGILDAFVRRRVLRETARTPGGDLELEFLGARVVRDGSLVRLSEKEFELLALLGSAHAALSKERIGEALWDHLDPEEWGNNLKVTLSRLRSKLGMRDAVIVAEGRYRLSPAVRVDLRRAESVLRAWSEGRRDDTTRGELRRFTTAFSSTGMGRYERLPWAQGLIARMEDIVCRAGDALARDALETSTLDDALRYARDVAVIDPFDEGACEVVLRVLLERGDADGARRELRRYAASLADELGAEPSPRLAQLVRGWKHFGER